MTAFWEDEFVYKYFPDALQSSSKKFIMSYNQDLRGGIPPYSNNNPNIQTIPNTGSDQGFNAGKVMSDQSGQPYATTNTGSMGQTNTDTSYSSTAYDSSQQSGLGGQGYNQTSSYSNSGMGGSNYDTTQTSGGRMDSSQQQGSYGTNQNSAFTGDTYNNPSQQYQPTARKPSAGDKIKGTFEKISGKVTGNVEKVAHGEDLASGRTMP
ncbi:hypothetical protein BX666DRAFT_1986868 [Dichotomocladium elegans]|nr:hypothetical protein BX666DRAFT_1986868 [Dichotomocladium elegans]